jgi:hypothetical protein
VIVYLDSSVLARSYLDEQAAVAEELGFKRI